MIDGENGLIPGIYNYCDRWCERCEFTARCRVFAMEQERAIDVENFTSEDLVRELSNTFAEVKEMLIEAAEKWDIDLTAIDDEEFEQTSERTRNFIENQEAMLVAKQYALDGNKLLNAKDEWLDSSALDSELLNDALGVIYNYLFFIVGKLHSSFHSMLDLDGYEIPDALSDPQSDGNGSAKIALITTERSILAWNFLLNEQNASRVRPMIALLERTKTLTEKNFPLARDFIRPGFDELETVM